LLTVKDKSKSHIQVFPAVMVGTLRQVNASQAQVIGRGLSDHRKLTAPENGVDHGALSHHCCMNEVHQRKDLSQARHTHLYQ
jgi:hypothetical protein